MALTVFYVFAAVMSLQLSTAELRRELANSRLTDISPNPELLRAAVAANPRDSASWIALGLIAEREHDLSGAARSFARAEDVDRRYLPAWSSANFYFRHGDTERFWIAAARAAAMTYDDPRPLIILANRMEADPLAVLSRLRAPAVVERAYLDFLIGERRWDAAQTVALRISARRDPADSNRLRDFMVRAREAGRSDLVTPFCRETKDCHEGL